MVPPEDGPSRHSQETSGFSMNSRHGDSIDVSYPHVGMDITSLSDSPNWVGQGCYLFISPNRVWQVCDSLSELIRTTWWQLRWTHCKLETDRSCLGTRPGILASTCKAFDFWLCNPRVSGRGGSGLGRPSGMLRECTWITAREEACSESGCTFYVHILGATAIYYLLASEQVVWTFFLRVGVHTGLLGVTVESISSGEIGTRNWTGEQGSAVATARKRFPRVYSCKRCRLAETRREYRTAGLGSIVANRLKPVLLDIPSYRSMSSTNWELTVADGANTTTKTLPTHDGGHILIPAIYGDFVEVHQSQGGDTPTASVNCK